jgi:transposase
MRVKIMLPTNRGRAITILGGIGNCLHQAVFVHGESTNKERVEALLKELRLHSTLPPEEKIYVVLDNHTAHHSHDVVAQMAELNFEPLYMPPYSPEFNSIESLWGVLKKQLQTQILLQPMQPLPFSTLSEMLAVIYQGVTQEQQAKAAASNNWKYVVETAERLAPN